MIALSERNVKMVNLSYNGLSYETAKQLIKMMKNAEEVNLVGNNVPKRKEHKL